MTLKPIRILLVEDDEIDRHGVERQLQKSQLPYTLRIAASSKEAQELLRDAESYDVVLLDYELGDGTAFELLSSAGRTPAVIITGNGSEEVAAEAARRLRLPDQGSREELPGTATADHRKRPEPQTLGTRAGPGAC